MTRTPWSSVSNLLLLLPLLLSLLLFPCPSLSLSYVPSHLLPLTTAFISLSLSLSLHINTLVSLFSNNKPRSLQTQTLSLSQSLSSDSFPYFIKQSLFGSCWSFAIMELQLGLALPANNNDFPVKGGLDLNINDFLYHPTDGSCKNKKRSFTQAFEPSIAVPRRLPWLLWNNQPNDGDDDDTEHSSRYTIMTKNEEDGLVGWPPIKSWRKETCFHIHGDDGGRRLRRVNDGGSTFVKVKMEGVGIARKIDLSQHQSFQTLLTTLMHMFDKCEMDSNNYKLTYQDREGDWLLAHDQDVPWRTFVRSVQRLKLLKRGE